MGLVEGHSVLTLVVPFRAQSCYYYYPHATRTYDSRAVRLIQVKAYSLAQTCSL
ncbi:MAG: hypothetical protein IKI10_08385 [Muribaculaceae bacterium]|nr:hypothetical protein [Muribaculaceae bacterium]